MASLYSDLWMRIPSRTEELVLQGERKEVERFLEKVRERGWIVLQGSPRPVTEMKIEVEPPKGMEATATLTIASS